MLNIERYINELMTSNCYILWNDESRRCVVIDPGSEKSLREIEFIKEKKLALDYIILTHEHTDHNWGVNALVENFSEAKVVCHKICKENITMESSAYFRLYYDTPNYSYKIQKVDIEIENQNWILDWNGIDVRFIHTPGHSMGSMCILVNRWLFTGDTLMQYKPYINKRNGSKELYAQSVDMLMKIYPGDMQIYPGHGEIFLLKKYNASYGISNKED